MQNTYSPHYANTYFRREGHQHSILSHHRKGQHTQEMDEFVVCFPEPDFLRLVRETPTSSGELLLRVYDDGTVVHAFVRADAGKDAALGRHAMRGRYIKMGEKLTEDRLQGFLEGFLAASAGTPSLLVIVLEKDDGGFQTLGYIFPEGSPNATQMKILQYPTADEFHSRSILRTDQLNQTSVCVIGLGSGGSHIAVELVKAGVGRLVLIDDDRLEFCNIARHVCGVKDMGRLKTRALKDYLLNKNPNVRFETFEENINSLCRSEDLKACLKDCNLIVAATDTTESRYSINSLSLETGITTLYGKCGPKAAGGEVVRVQPGKSPCLACMYGNIASQNEASDFKRVRNAFPDYVSDEEVSATIQLGLSSDIIPMANMVVKLALVELTRGQSSAIESLDTDFQAPFYQWANRREGDYKDYPQDGFRKATMMSILRWYPVNMEKDTKCLVCQMHKRAAANQGKGGASFFAEKQEQT